MYGRRRQLSAEETTANEAKRQWRRENSMTCQICNSDILANTGCIAHHGYRRPSYGWQTASCSGARELPFEVDRTVLGAYIVSLRERRKDWQKALWHLRRETRPLSHSWNEKMFDDKTRKFVQFTRDTFEQVKAENEIGFSRYVGIGSTYDSFKRREIISALRELSTLTGYIRRQQRRYDDWKQTKLRLVGTDGKFQQWVGFDLGREVR